MPERVSAIYFMDSMVNSTLDTVLSVTGPRVAVRSGDAIHVVTMDGEIGVFSQGDYLVAAKEGLQVWDAEAFEGKYEKIETVPDSPGHAIWELKVTDYAKLYDTIRTVDKEWSGIFDEEAHQLVEAIVEAGFHR